MAWAYDSVDFEYDDWAPYAVFEDDDVLVIRSEGDYFFALRINNADDEWLPLPLQSDDPDDLERLQSVARKLRETLNLFRARLQLQAPKDVDAESVVHDEETWRSTDDYDALWGRLQWIVPALLRMRDRLGGENT